MELFKFIQTFYLLPLILFYTADYWQPNSTEHYAPHQFCQRRSVDSWLTLLVCHSLKQASERLGCKYKCEYIYSHAALLNLPAQTHCTPMPS